MMEGLKRVMWVYGSLRSGEYNNYVLAKGKYLGKGLIRGFKMYSFGCYPFIVQTWDNDDIVVVEGFEVDVDLANEIDVMEIRSGYRIIHTEVEVERGGVTNGGVYIMDNVYRNYGEVEGGDWVANKYKRYGNENRLM